MPTVEATTRPLAESDAALVAVGAFTAASGERGDPPELATDAAAVAEAAGIDLVAELAAAGFDASAGTTLRVPTRGALPSPTLLVVGLGDRDEATLDTLRVAGAAAANAAERVTGLAVGLTDVLEGVSVASAVQALTEGLLLGSYRFSAYRTDAPPFELEAASVHVAEAAADEARSAVEVAVVTAQAAALARDLVNTPPQDKRPPQLADRIVAEVGDLPIEVRVLDEEALAAGGYG
ncbi:MAG: M17 family peptidase N-terminal domain-containing protein, partial [Nitriliruptoraceae bacterium]